MVRQGGVWKALALFFLISSADGFFAATCHLPPEEDLGVEPSIQGMDNWCWAACAEMAMRKIGGSSPAQCEMAKFRTRHNDCCTDTGGRFPFPAHCNQTGWPPFGHFGYRFRRTHNRALSYAQIQEQIHCKRKPVVFSRRLVENGHPVQRGHILVISGYTAMDGQRLNVIDPESGEVTSITYDEYVGIPGQAAHWDDFYEITKIH